ncbi:hypothetical protein PENFLA_c020G03493 [Penicillium flavigenum]|uniref:Uncharacterized protein n=1 Tax=Penicillium flavigenum TaxID=254877 RepID=A0A1V6SY42_9EURO|nr:hypothetical protein PENFLA_c020G03493 [Penicillium flavigenum]
MTKLKLVCNTLSDEYELDMGAKPQPACNIDDLLFSTYHLLVVCAVAFPTFRCQSKLSTLRKIMASTSARPGTLVETSGYMRSNNALKWQDIELYMVKNPEDPKCQVLLIRVKFETTTKKPDQSPFMMKSSTGLECPICLGCISSIYQTARQFPYARKGVLQKHFKTYKLPYIFPKGR